MEKNSFDAEKCGDARGIIKGSFELGSQIFILSLHTRIIKTNLQETFKRISTTRVINKRNQETVKNIDTTVFYYFYNSESSIGADGA